MTILTDIIPSVGLAQRTTIGHAIQHVAAGTGANMFNFFYCLSGNDSNLLIVFYVQIMPDDFVMQLHRF